MTNETIKPGLGRLKGKSVVITGAAGGIGRATALLFASEGARLIVSDKNASRLEDLHRILVGSGVDAHIVVGDVSIPEDAQRMILAAVEHYGRIDSLIANAGVIVLNNFLEATADDWDRIMSIDGRGMFLTCKYAVE
jgi:NAD(P)-dependent dehydrogenase (short-subunit alcohol dehydrogenase family)